MTNLYRNTELENLNWPKSAISNPYVELLRYLYKKIRIVFILLKELGQGHRNKGIFSTGMFKYINISSSLNVQLEDELDVIAEIFQTSKTKKPEIGPSRPQIGSSYFTKQQGYRVWAQSFEKDSYNNVGAWKFKDHSR